MTTIFWAGDSTVKQNTIETYPQTGIGQAFAYYTRMGEVAICDCAENGRSTKSFIDEGRLAKIYDDIREGDFLFIQFGHNDEKIEDQTRYAAADGDFVRNLEKFVNVARNKKATPVLITPLCRRLFPGNTEAYRHVHYARAVKEMAERLGVACIDLTAMSEKLVTELGEEAEHLYMNLPAGKFPNYPDGQTDNTHLQPEGALRFAGLIADGLWALGGSCRELLTPVYGEYREKHPTMNAEAAREA